MRVFLTVCLLIPWEWSLSFIVLLDNLDNPYFGGGGGYVDYNYPQFNSLFVFFSSSQSKSNFCHLSHQSNFFLSRLEFGAPYFPQHYIFSQARNCRLIHRKYFCQITLFSAWIYKSIACVLCPSEMSCCLPSIVYNDNSKELNQGGQLKLHARGDHTPYSLFQASLL